ncbi:MAG: hypothetical protein DPW16_10485 [Chloroflexi bacterium]|nr:hypothetical protein [Chloroflexota bacterium]
MINAMRLVSSKLPKPHIIMSKGGGDNFIWLKIGILNGFLLHNPYQIQVYRPKSREGVTRSHLSKILYGAVTSNPQMEH